MVNNLYHKAFIKSKFLSIFIILTFNQIKISLCVREDTCRNVTSCKNTTCFNDKIEFHESFRAGHFETLKDESLMKVSKRKISKLNLNDNFMNRFKTNS